MTGSCVVCGSCFKRMSNRIKYKTFVAAHRDAKTPESDKRNNQLQLPCMNRVDVATVDPSVSVRNWLISLKTKGVSHVHDARIVPSLSLEKQTSTPSQPLNCMFQDEAKCSYLLPGRVNLQLSAACYSHSEHSDEKKNLQHWDLKAKLTHSSYPMSD